MSLKKAFRFGLLILLSLLQFVQFAPEVWAKANSPAKKGTTVRKQIAKKVQAKKRPSARQRRLIRQRAMKKARPAKRRVTARAPGRSSRAVRTVRSRGTRTGVLRMDGGTSAPALNASAVFVADEKTSEVLLAKNAQQVMPIASITKLMTALVVLEAGQPLDEVLTVTRADIDRIKHTGSRLRIGSRLTRANMLHIALMSSENRAASALGRNYPGGLRAFVAAMNAKAKKLGMRSTRYVEPTGLSSRNVSTPRDLARLISAAQQHPLIRRYSTHREYEVDPGGPSLHYRNSNRLIASGGWDILLQKTGYISEAGRCLVMQTRIKGRSVVMVLLNAKGKFARAADAGRIRRWLESGALSAM